MYKRQVIGSAVTLALSCDFRIAAYNTWFWLPDPQYGGLAADGCIDLIKSMCGISAAKEILMSNKRLDSGYLKSKGLVTSLHSDIEYISEIKKFCSEISGFSSKTLKYTKRIINKTSLKTFRLLELIKTVNSQEMLDRLDLYIRKPKI